jgi:hypothetical protein
MKMPTNVMKFSAENGLKVLHEVFADYWNERRSRDGVKGLSFSNTDAGGNVLSFDQKEETLNRIFRKEVCRLAKIDDMSEFGLATWATNPTVLWTSFAVINSIIDYILPVTLLDSMKAYADIRTGGYGDSFKFDVKPRDLFPVTAASRNKRTAELQRQYNGTVTLVPENRMVTVYVSLYRVLAGLDNLSDFVSKAVISLQNEMLYDVYTAFNTAMGSLPTTPADGELKFVGYSQSNLTKLIQRVKAYNAGAKPIILGTLLALQPILPSSANFRFDLESEYVRMGYISNFLGADVVVLDQIADWKNPFKLLLDDTRIYVVSPGNQKIVKLCLEGDTITNTSGAFDNADLTQTTTLQKAWKAGVVTNSVGGIITAS